MVNVSLSICEFEIWCIFLVVVRAFMERSIVYVEEFIWSSVVYLVSV